MSTRCRLKVILKEIPKTTLSGGVPFDLRAQERGRGGVEDLRKEIPAKLLYFRTQSSLLTIKKRRSAFDLVRGVGLGCCVFSLLSPRNFPPQFSPPNTPRIALKMHSTHKYKVN